MYNLKGSTKTGTLLSWNAVKLVIFSFIVVINYFISKKVGDYDGKINLCR